MSSGKENVMAKTYKVYIDPGHGGKDKGAVKYLVERDVNLVMAKACRDYLKANGVTTKMSRTTNLTRTSISTMAKKANSWKADYVISIHNNAGNGDGFEVYHTLNGGKGKTLAKNIEAEVKKLGQNSRGLKTKKGNNGDYYGIIRLTNAPAIICEGVFVDNKKDYKIADTKAEQKKFGYAYARGILKTLGLKDNGLKGTSTTSSTKTTSSTSSKSSSKLSAHFDKSEFKCKCKGKYCNGYPCEMSSKLINLLEELRAYYGKPVTITSGLRCTKHNSAVGGVSGSAHTKGKAADIYIPGVCDTKDGRNKVKAKAYELGAAYSYCNTPGMGNAVHINV